MLYTQGGDFHIYVHKARGGGGSLSDENGGRGGKVESPSEKGGGAKQSAKDSKRAAQRREKFIRVNATHTMAVAFQVGLMVGNYQMGGIGFKNGDQSLQESTQRGVEKITDTWSFASSICMGATYGAAGGPLGSVIGAALGAVSSATSLGVKYAGRHRDYSVKEFKLNNEIAYKRARANINLTTGRLR